MDHVIVAFALDSSISLYRFAGVTTTSTGAVSSIPLFMYYFLLVNRETPDFPTQK